MDLLKDLNISLLKYITFNHFYHFYHIDNMLVLLKNQDNIFECFLKKYNRLLFFSKKIFFFIIHNEKKSKACRRKHN